MDSEASRTRRSTTETRGLGPSPEGSTDPSISVIVPTYNRDDELCALLNALFRQSYPAFEIVVVDQSESHSIETDEFLRQLHAAGQIRLVQLSHPSTTRARNAGMAAANGEIFIFCDDDVVVERRFVEQHAGAYRDSTTYGVTGRIVEINKAMDLGKVGSPTGRMQSNGFCSMGFGRDVPADVEVMMGGNMSFRRSVYETIGVFDPAFTGTAFREEFDFSYRAHRAGFRLRFDPAIEIQHINAPRGGANRAIDDALVDRFAGETYFFLRHMPHRDLPLFLFARWRRFVFPGTVRIALKRRRLRALFAPHLGVIIGVTRFIRNARCSADVFVQTPSAGARARNETLGAGS